MNKLRILSLLVKIFWAAILISCKSGCQALKAAEDNIIVNIKTLVLQFVERRVLFCFDLLSCFFIIIIIENLFNYIILEII